MMPRHQTETQVPRFAVLDRCYRHKDSDQALFCNKSLLTLRYATPVRGRQLTHRRGFLVRKLNLSSVYRR